MTTPPAPLPGPSRVSRVGSVAGPVLGLALGLWAGIAALGAVWPGSLDDAFVVLVHARNLLEGHGPVHRPGGPPVDGFTSPLDLAAKALGLLASDGDGMRAAWASTGLAYLGALLLLGGLAVRWGRSGPLALLLVPAAMLAPGLAEGATYRLGTPLFVAVLAAFLAAVVRPARASGEGGDGAGPLRTGRAAPAVALGVLLALARPEGVPLALAGLAWWGREARGPAPAAVGAPSAARARYAPLGVLAVLLAAGAVVRRLWIGTWLPNTFHAKRSSSTLAELGDGLEYLLGLARLPSGACVLVGLALLPALLGRARSRAGAADDPAAARARRAARAATAMAWVALVVSVLEGGDSYLAGGATEGTRLHAPLAALVLVGLVAAGRAAPGWRGALACALALGSLAGRLPGLLPHWSAVPAALAAPAPSDADHACEAELSRVLGDAARALAPGDAVAHRDLQCLGWFEPELPLVDLSGLTDPEVAHLPRSGRVRFGKDGLVVALERRACLVHLDFQRVRPEPWSAHALADLLARPERWERFAGGAPPAGEVAARLRAGYRPASLPLEACGGWLNVLVREDLARGLAARGFDVGR